VIEKFLERSIVGLFDMQPNEPQIHNSNSNNGNFSFAEKKALLPLENCIVFVVAVAAAEDALYTALYVCTEIAITHHFSFSKQCNGNGRRR
jgi:hypothetical protein